MNNSLLLKIKVLETGQRTPPQAARFLTNNFSCVSTQAGHSLQAPRSQCHLLRLLLPRKLFGGRTWLSVLALSLLLLYPFRAKAVEISDLVGTWDMIHDDWAGTLEIFPPDQRVNAVDGACTFTYWIIDGQWKGADGAAHRVHGTFAGRDDSVRGGGPCPASPHLVEFNTEFGSGEPPQPFKGYIFTHGRRRMAGLTWWHGLPFGWYANKR